MTKRTALFAILLVVARPASAQLRIDPYIWAWSLPGVRPGSHVALHPIRRRAGRPDSGDSERRAAADAVSSMFRAPFASAASAACSASRFRPTTRYPAASSSTSPNTHGDTVVARFKRSIGNPLVADSGDAVRSAVERRAQRFIAQPFANHNGGHLAFGPDGFLYVALGDGGSGDDPLNTAQNPTFVAWKDSFASTCSSADRESERLHRPR